jgi:hypothetical protein
MQENPKSLTSSLAQLKEKTSAGAEFWQRMVNRSGKLRRALSEREKQLNEETALASWRG